MLLIYGTVINHFLQFPQDNPDYQQKSTLLITTMLSTKQAEVKYGWASITKKLTSKIIHKTASNVTDKRSVTFAVKY
jgi:hypothetical protein